MADSTVNELADVYGYEDAKDALRHTAQAMAIVRAVSLAVAAQVDGSVLYDDDNRVSRWVSAIDAACARVRLVRNAIINRAAAPDSVDWCTPLNILEATGAALWHMDFGHVHEAMSHDDLQSVCEAAISSIGEMYEELSTVADGLRAADAMTDADHAA